MASSLLPDVTAVQAVQAAAAQDATQAINTDGSADRAKIRRENSQTYTQKDRLFDFRWDFYPDERYRCLIPYSLLAKTLPKIFTTSSIRDPSKHQDQELRTASEDIARGYFGPNIPKREAYQQMEDFELRYKGEFYNSSSYDYRFLKSRQFKGWSHDGHCFILERNTSDDPVSDKPVSDKPVSDDPVSDDPVSDKPVSDKPVVYFPVMVSIHDNLAYNRAGDLLGQWENRHLWPIGHVTANYFTTPSFD